MSSILFSQKWTKQLGNLGSSKSSCRIINFCYEKVVYNAYYQSSNLLKLHS